MGFTGNRRQATAKKRSLVEHWVGRLDSRESRHRQWACQKLARLGDRRAAEPLIQRLDDVDWRFRQAVCQALGRLGDTRAVEPLIRRLRDEYLNVRRAACQALGRLGDRRAAEPLVGLLEDGDEYVRRRACQALGKLGDARAVGPLIERLQDDDEHVRRAASQVLVELVHKGDSLAAEILIRWLENAGSDVLQAAQVRGKAAKAILGIKEVVAVLDTLMGKELSCTDGVARVSYLKRDAPFDFDRVEIVRAGDYEVERFCVQVGNDADPFRRGRYRKMRCVVGRGCHLSENTLRILRSMFGKVEVRT
jgi:HEAT repeat protein